MGVRGEIFSTKVSLQNRTYFFNVKENRMGDIYLNIVESKNRETGGFERQSVILFADDLGDFLKGFEESLKVMEKAAREKKKPLPQKVKNEDGSFKKRGKPGDPHVIVKKRDSSKAGKEKNSKDKKPRPRAVKAVRREEDK